MAKFPNFLLFQLGWLGVAFSAAADLPWIATAVALLVLGLNLAFCARPSEEAKLALGAGALGLILDSLLTAAGLLRFESGQWVGWLAPHWIVALWLMFATLLNSSLDWLKGRYVLAALLGAAAGPVAYWGGARLGALSLAAPSWTSLTAVALVWLIAMPALLRLANRWDGVHPEPQPTP
jgi:hypothetical protein